MVAIKLPDIMSGLRTLDNIFSVGVLDWLIILVVCKIKGINELKPRESKILLSDYAHYNSIN